MNEKQLINKNYYQTFLQGNDNHTPLQTLGDTFFQEQKKEGADLSLIRFAQGELYFHNKDMESAIYKWQTVTVDSPLESWAKKNIGDAYYELGWLNEAEKTYNSIHTKNEVLLVEVALQLFSLYKDKYNVEQAYLQIDKAISLNPDYPKVTEIARVYYEDQQDWKNAVILSINEATRTESLQWYNILNGYVIKGYTIEFVPEYFLDALHVLSKLEQRFFCQLTKSLWNSYKGNDSFLPWIKVVNQLFANVEWNEHEDGSVVNQQREWNDITHLFYESFLLLMNGDYLIKDIEIEMPNLLSNSLKIANKNIFLAAAAMAWNEFFPSSIENTTLKMAEKILFNNEPFTQSHMETEKLYKTLMEWAETNQIGLNDTEEVKTSSMKTTELLSIIQNTLSEMLEKRIGMENTYNKTIDQTNERIGRLKGLVNTLKDMEIDQTKAILKSYRLVKEETQKELELSIPRLLQNSADNVTADSNYKAIHDELDKKMNQKIEEHLHKVAFPLFRKSLKTWIKTSEGELKDTQKYLNDMTDSLNKLDNENQITLTCDFQILSDWHRDLNRLVHRMAYEKVNIMNRSKPSHLLLKSAGKLFGNMKKNKQILSSQYRKMVENDSYEDITDVVLSNFFQEYDLFEKAIVSDIALFFQSPFKHLTKIISNEEREIQSVKDKLIRIKEKPEHFYNPIRLFEVRLLQCQILKKTNENYTYVSSVSVDGNNITE
ncbi:tetratricopeptide repeat protein [Evansella tamaricis]|uniref:Tetratricopeptide repeat protein n=1 Tax=Evansella tamaricis TaxID=2069301 RepID=A0ABS6JH06_9BACI|nr:hypothetical protein [Evansella tamaricis]MBU9712818.1 hypothetical protein [Evansella tamaricis]